MLCKGWRVLCMGLGECPVGAGRMPGRGGWRVLCRGWRVLCMGLGECPVWGWGSALWGLESAL